MLNIFDLNINMMPNQMDAQGTHGKNNGNIKKRPPPGCVLNSFLSIYWKSHNQVTHPSCYFKRKGGFSHLSRSTCMCTLCIINRKIG